MQTFKELIIKQPQTCTMPCLSLNGKWIENLGFTVGKVVSVTYYDSCLTLTIDSLIENHSNTLVVESKLVRKQPRTHLDIGWFLLRRYGFHVGDRVALTLEVGKIQIQKIVKYTTVECS